MPFSKLALASATGGIAELFAKDLLIDPSTRSVSDVSHTITAVASSSSASRASDFVKSLEIPNDPATYGSYDELVKDPNVDCIYVATPHSHHYQNCMLALNAGKNVLCEKSFTTNAAQTQKLIAVAKEKNLFLMEAVWTRYFPLSIAIREFIQAGNLGTVYRVIVDNSFGDDIAQKYGTSHRMVNPNLAGGALLDLGIYSLTWVFQTLYTTLPISQRKPPSDIKAIMTRYPATGVDESTSILLKFPNAPPHSQDEEKEASPPAQGIALTSLRTASNVDGHGISLRGIIKIQGSRGEIQVDGPAYRPRAWRYIRGNAEKGPRRAAATTEKQVGIEEHKCDIPAGHGMFWEADEVARALRDGRKEGSALGWEESVVIMGVMDEVRRQGGVRYPERIETVEYPVELE